MEEFTDCYFRLLNRNIIEQNMSGSFNQVFLPLTAAHLDVLGESSSMVLKNNFQIKIGEDTHETVMMGITANFILLSHVQQGIESTYFCPLNFDLKFQILRNQWMDSKTPGIPLGIRFQKDVENIAVQFYNSNPGIITQWGNCLSKKINQRNFHQLFKAKKKIGKGAFASVYLAERLTDKKMVAVKAFSKQKQFSGDKGKQALENQIKLMRTIDHPNITKLQEVYETDNSIYVILECLHGKQMNEVIKSNNKFTLEEVIGIMRQILSGLDHLSEKRIIHRDLKPDNIMFKKENGIQVSICDFGLATFADEEKYLFVRCGTPGFVAPEIINIRDMNTKSDPISDVFSAGVIFHLLLLGFSVFPGTKYNEVLSQNRSCEFNFSRKQYESLPSSSLAILKRMLEKDPSLRPSAEQCLKSDFFRTKESQMDIEQPEKKPLKQFNFIPISKKPTINIERNTEMQDENSQPQNNQNIGQIIKKKLSFMNNESSVKMGSSYTFKKYL